jgi:hypothetical protein
MDIRLWKLSRSHSLSLSTQLPVVMSVFSVGHCLDDPLVSQPRHASGLTGLASRWRHRPGLNFYDLSTFCHCCGSCERSHETVCCFSCPATGKCSSCWLGELLLGLSGCRPATLTIPLSSFETEWSSSRRQMRVRPLSHPCDCSRTVFPIWSQITIAATDYI